MRVFQTISLVLLLIIVFLLSTAEAQAVCTPSDLGAQQIEHLLPEGMSGLGESFWKAEQMTGINAMFLVAIARLESGNGQSRLAKEKNNLFGWTSGQEYKTFSDRRSCVLYVAMGLKEKYIDCGLDTIDQIGQVYCEGPEWAERVGEIYANWNNG